MVYRVAEDLRLDAERDRALTIEDELPPGAFNALPRETGNALQRLRDRCDAVGGKPADPAAAATLWASYGEEIGRFFGPEDRARGPEHGLVLTALKWRFALDEGAWLIPPQRDAAAMVALARTIDPDAAVDWIDQRILVTKLALRGQPIVLVVRKRSRLSCIAGVRISRRAPGLIVEPETTFVRLARKTASLPETFARRFTLRGPCPHVAPEAMVTLLDLEREGAEPLFEQRDGLATLSWRQDTEPSAGPMLDMMAQLRERYRPPHALTITSPPR